MVPLCGFMAPGVIPHLKPRSSLCDIRWGLRTRRWQEAPRQQSVLVPGWGLSGTDRAGELGGDHQDPGPCLAAAGASQPRSSQEMVGTGSVTWFFPRLERPSWGRGGESIAQGRRVVSISGAAESRVHLGPRHSTIPFPFMPSKKKKLL